MHYQFILNGDADVLQHHDVMEVTKSGTLRFYRKREVIPIRNVETGDASPRYETLLGDLRGHEAAVIAVFCSLLSGNSAELIDEHRKPSFHFQFDRPLTEGNGALSQPRSTVVSFRFQRQHGHPTSIQLGDQFMVDPRNGGVAYVRQFENLYSWDVIGKQKHAELFICNHPLEEPQIHAIAGLFSLLSNLPVRFDGNGTEKHLFTFGK